MSGITVGRIIFCDGKCNLFKRKENKFFLFYTIDLFLEKRFFFQYEFEGVFDNLKKYMIIWSDEGMIYFIVWDCPGIAECLRSSFLFSPDQ